MGVYQHNQSCALQITPGVASYTTLREQDQFTQTDKSISRIGEVTHDIQAYEQRYAVGEKPKITITTRQGMFEYAFIYCQFRRSGSRSIVLARAEKAIPTTSPIVEALRLHVESNENQFVRDLDVRDLELMSRSNSHELCDFRALHDSGRGLLLHLADLGLTQGPAFGERKRLEIIVQLLATSDPDVETGPTGATTELAIAHMARSFHVVLIRHNRLLAGDHTSMRYTYLNES